MVSPWFMLSPFSENMSWDFDRRGCRKFAMAKRAIRTAAVDVPLPDREGT